MNVFLLLSLCKEFRAHQNSEFVKKTIHTHKNHLSYGKLVSLKN